MPLLRYFIVVGSCLLAIMFAFDAYFPKPVVAVRNDIDKTTIRIRADAPVVQPVTIDTRQPTIAPPIPPVVAEEAVRDAFARLEEEPKPVSQPFAVKKAASRKPKRAAVVLARPVLPGFFDTW